MVSRASRDRRSAAKDAPSVAEGYHLDWMFTRHDLGKDLVWGREFSLCERAGSVIENTQKVQDNTLKVKKTLKDMHRTLLDAILASGGGTLPESVLNSVHSLRMPGFLSSGFFIRVILVVYLGAGFYLSTDISEFNIPTSYEELGDVLKMARIMLQVKGILQSTVETFVSQYEGINRKEEVHSGECDVGWPTG